MSRATEPTTRAIALAGLFLTAALAAPAAAQANGVTSERMLLNRIASTPDRSTGFAAAASYSAAATASARIDGASALLGRGMAPKRRYASSGTVGFAAPAARIAGERALLGAVASTKSRREGDE